MAARIHIFEKGCEFVFTNIPPVLFDCYLLIMLFERTKTLSSFLWHVSHFRQLRVSLSPDYEDNGYGDYDDDEQHDHCHNHSDRQSTQTRSLGLSARIVDALLPCRTAGLIVGQVRSGDDD